MSLCSCSPSLHPTAASKPFLNSGRSNPSINPFYESGQHIQNMWLTNMNTNTKFSFWSTNCIWVSSIFKIVSVIGKDAININCVKFKVPPLLKINQLCSFNHFSLNFCKLKVQGSKWPCWSTNWAIDGQLSHGLAVGFDHPWDDGASDRNNDDDDRGPRRWCWREWWWWS